MVTSCRPTIIRRNRSTFAGRPSRYLRIVQTSLLFLERIRPSATVPSSSSTAQSTPGGSFGAGTITNFLRNRCGSTETNDNETPAIWSYEGTLSDLMTGKLIAKVEGLELVKSLPAIGPSQVSDNNDQSMFMKNLLAKDLLCPRKNSLSFAAPWDAATTVLSRRLFCYKRPSSNPNNEHQSNIANSNNHDKQSSPYNSLLTSLRLRINGPLRHLSPFKNIAIYDSAITYISSNK